MPDVVRTATRSCKQRQGGGCSKEQNDRHGDKHELAAKGGGCGGFTDDAADESDAGIKRRVQPAAEPAVAPAATERDQSAAKVDSECGVDLAVVVETGVEIGVVLEQARIPAQDDYGVSQEAKWNNECGDRSATESDGA